MRFSPAALTMACAALPVSVAVAQSGPELEDHLRFNGLPAPVSARQLINECRDMQQQPALSLKRQDCERLDRHIQWLESRLKTLCPDAGERISRTVVDVEAVYLKPPSRGPDESFGMFHEDERLSGSYMSPQLGRHYSQWEMDSFRTEGKIENRRYEIVPQGKGRAKINEPFQQLDRPTAQYGVTWRTIGDREERRLGIYGDETSVFEVATGAVLAVRRFYYYVLDPGRVDESGRPLYSQFWDRRGFPAIVQACRSYRIKENVGYLDYRPRDSYEFVSRVLKPKLMRDELAVGIFDLARGSGGKSGECISTTFGPRIAPGDLEVTRIYEHGIKIAIKGTPDALTCSTFYHPAMLDFAHRSTYRFYDGTRWTFEDINKRVLPIAARGTN